jgi:hypothetical protein
VAPTYENWEVIYELKDGDKLVWFGKSSFNPKLFHGTKTVTDSYELPTGDLSLYIRVIDPTGYRQPLPLANAGRLSDGSYKLK